MAPMAFGDTINLNSMIGTWLGTLFTLIGLAAVIGQLRTLLKDFSTTRDEIVKAAAGDWAVCLPRLRQMDNWIIEGKAPSLRAWIHYQYNEGESIAVCPYERKSLSGQSSWSQLFCRLQIMPQDLLNPGHRDGFGQRTMTPLQVPTTADILVNGSKISYGLPGDDFAALLILSGFSPSSFHPKETTKTTSHVGHMYVAAHSDPFSQIAQLDSASWNSSGIFRTEKWDGRYADRLNVRHCLDLALGILRFDCAGRPATLLFCTGDINMASSPTPDKSPWRKPSPQEVLNTRRSLTEMTGGSIDQNPLYDITRTSFPNFSWIFGGGPPFNARLTELQINTIFEIAFGLNALKPWGLLPVIPHSIVDTFSPYLREVFAKESQGPPSILTLTQRFRALPANVPYTVPHRTREGMDSALDSLSEVEERGFFGLSSRCSLYYDAMIYVFKNHNLKLEDVEIGLAAHCASNFARSKLLSQCRSQDGYNPLRWEEDQYNPLRWEEDQYNTLQWEVEFRAFLRACLKGSPMNEVEPWACEILAMYLHAWLQEAKDIKENFLTNFRRRVFLG